MKRISTYALIISLAFSSGFASATMLSQEMKSLIGYTVVASDSIEKVITHGFNNKHLKLYGGATYKITFMPLDPFVLTDVIIFAMPLSSDLINKYKGKIPEKMLYSYKLLINDKIYDATLQ